MPLLYRLLYFFTTSFAFAVGGYYLLLSLKPNQDVFGAMFRMFVYHRQYPISYITIVCAVFSVVASLGVRLFQRETTQGRIALTAGIIVVTILISSPLGGILWQYHDIMEGYWPGPYGWKKLFVKGPLWGLSGGWLIILFSIPYSYVGAVVGYFILSYGSRLFGPGKPVVVYTADANLDVTN